MSMKDLMASLETLGGAIRNDAKEPEIAYYQTHRPVPVRLAEPAPVAVSIQCPHCRHPHVDEGEWASRPHKTHQCQICMHEWRPFEFATVGVGPRGRLPCQVRQYSDETQCSTCGLRWDTNDAAPPPCPRA